MSQHDDFTPAPPRAPIEIEPTDLASPDADFCAVAGIVPMAMTEISNPMPDAAAPNNTAATAEAAPAGLAPVPAVGAVIAVQASIPTAEDSIRFVIERARFKYFGRRMSARGPKYADEPVRLTTTPEVLIFDLSSAAIPSTTAVPYAEGGCPTKMISFEAPARVFYHLAKPNKKEPGPNGKPYFEGSVVFIASISEAVICLLDEGSKLCFSIIDRTPVRAKFPEAAGTPTQCEAIILHRALLAVKPAASRDAVRELPLCQIKIEDAQATAVRHQLFAHYCHPTLAGLQFRIAKRDINAVATLLTLTDATVTVQADDDGVVIEHERTRFGFRPLPESMPDIHQIVEMQPTHLFECDRVELCAALVLASLVVSGPGARVLQIGFSFVARNRSVCLQAITEWRPNTYKCTRIPIRMTTDGEMALLNKIDPYQMAGKPAGATETGSSTLMDGSSLSNGPTEIEGNESMVEEDLPLLELGHYLHTDVLKIVEAMSAPVLSCGFMPGRALFVTGMTGEVDAMYMFAPETPNQAHGLTPRRR